MSWGRTVLFWEVPHRCSTQFWTYPLKNADILLKQKSHRDKIEVLSSKICRSEYSLVICAAFTTSVSIVLTELDSQRKCNRNLAADMTSWDYKKKYSDLKFYCTMAVSTYLKARTCWVTLWDFGNYESSFLKRWEVIASHCLSVEALVSQSKIRTYIQKFYGN